METINKKDLIPLLKKSRLVDQFDDKITIPKKYVLNEINITDNNTFYKVMDILRFYMVEELPHEIYDYVLKHKPDSNNAIFR